MSLLERMGTYLMWADKTMWRLVQDLTDEEFNRVLCETGSSLRKRYIHLARDTWEWYFDWINEDPKAEPNFEEMTRAELFESIREYNKRFIEMIKSQSVASRNFKMKKGMLTISFEEMLFHMVNHATYHRGQIAMGLRLLGKNTTMTDYVPYRIHVTEKSDIENSES